MGNWSYFELIAIIFQNYLKIVDSNRSTEAATGYLSYDFFSEAEGNFQLQNMIVSAICILLDAKVNRKLRAAPTHFFHKQLQELDSDLPKTILNPREFEHFTDLIQEVEILIKITPVHG